MKRNILITVLVTILIGLAQAQLVRSDGGLRAGELLVLKTELPADTRAASFALGGQVHGLLMKKQADGTWEGRFAILPSMAGTTIRPIVTARLADGRTVNQAFPQREVEGAIAKQGDGFVAQEDGNVMFVFDETIRLDTVEVVTEKGILPRPSYESNYFRLPSSVAKDEVVSIRAQSIHGEQLEIRPSLQASL